jgi:YebC/PmpR family DNA-binding regulatory protein
MWVMSGHSKWSTIKRQKGANDAKRGALFTKFGNQIAVAARGGADPSMNPTLAMVVEKAKKAGMPLSNIERAIARVGDKSAAIVEEVTYEAYGPGGIAIIIEAATDNKNRTYPEVRSTLTKNGGNIAEPGSVAFQFDRKGIIRTKLSGDPDEALLSALDAGAEDAQEEEGQLTIYSEPKELHNVRSKLADAGLEVIDAELGYVPKNAVQITDAETANKVIRLMDAIEDLDDIVATHSNFDLSDDVSL